MTWSDYQECNGAVNWELSGPVQRPMSKYRNCCCSENNQWRTNRSSHYWGTVVWIFDPRIVGAVWLESMISTTSKPFATGMVEYSMHESEARCLPHAEAEWFRCALSPMRIKEQHALNTWPTREWAAVPIPTRREQRELDVLSMTN